MDTTTYVIRSASGAIVKSEALQNSENISAEDIGDLIFITEQGNNE